MKFNYTFIILAVIVFFSCENKKEKERILKEEKELEIKTQISKRLDSLQFEEAAILYQKKEWEKAIEKFREIKNTDFYKEKSGKYIEEIENRPWKNIYGGGLTTTLEGEFSNSATKDSPLWVEMTIYNRNQIWLDLYEYSSAKPSDRTSEKPSYNFTLYVDGEYLCQNVRPEEYYGIDEASHSEGIVISGKLAKRMIERIKKAENSCYIVIHMGSSSTYSFSVDTKTFEEEFNSL